MLFYFLFFTVYIVKIRFIKHYITPQYYFYFVFYKL